VEQNLQTNRNTIYSLQSITKLFISVSVFQLWERALINLHEDINLYLPFSVRNPNFPDRMLTPHMLLNHTSGLAWPADEDGIPDFHHFYSDEDPPLILEWLPEYILQGGESYRSTVWKDFAPGEQYLYSNIGTSLLALVVEQISGLDFRDYCRIYILEPLEMANSGFRLGALNSEDLVTPYTNNNQPMQFFSSRHYPAGFLNCSLEDFSHFVIAMLNKGIYNGNRIMEITTVEKMWEIQNQGNGISNLWAHCLGDCIAKKGGGTGFATWVEWHVVDGTAFFLFSNKQNGAIWPGGRIYDLVKYQCNKY
jgi:CubicO group peptidase (beta-lactamase class C family)